MNLLNGFTRTIDPEKKRQNEIAAIKAILADDPGNKYWLARLDQLTDGPELFSGPASIVDQRSASRAVSEASNDQLREWLEDLNMRRHIRETFTVFVEVSKCPADEQTIMLEIGRRINAGEWDR